MSTSRSRQASAAAPAPDVTSFTCSRDLPTRRRPLRIAAPTMIAVPCWSSWKTGIFRRCRSFASISKHSGALMSSRLMPPKVGSRDAMMSTSFWGSRSFDLDVEHVDAGEFLEQDRLALHHRLGGERADSAQAQHGGAVGDDADQIAARGERGRLGRGRRRSPGRLRPRPANRRARGRAGWPAAWWRRRRSFPAWAAGDIPARSPANPPSSKMPPPNRCRDRFYTAGRMVTPSVATAECGAKTGIAKAPAPSVGTANRGLARNKKAGAVEKTRTSTPFRALAPQASASTNSATTAGPARAASLSPVAGVITKSHAIIASQGRPQGQPWTDR